MVKLFFITVLVMTTKSPSLGWIQWNESYSDQKVCEDVIRRDYTKIAAAVKNYMGPIIKTIRELRCMTYQEALRLNSELGH